MPDATMAEKLVAQLLKYRFRKTTAKRDRTTGIMESNNTCDDFLIGKSAIETSNVNNQTRNP